MTCPGNARRVLTYDRRGYSVTASGSKVVLPQARPYPKALPFLAGSGYKDAGAGVLVPVRKPARGELEIDVKNPERAAVSPALPGRTRLRA
jgi:hypothetical protein